MCIIIIINWQLHNNNTYLHRHTCQMAMLVVILEYKTSSQRTVTNKSQKHGAATAAYNGYNDLYMLM